MYDVLIIGLGPAGSTLARNLSKDKKVCAVDLKCLNEKDGFKKPCGGLLSPDAQKALAKQGLVLPSEILVTPQIFAVYTIDLNTKITRHYQRCYLNINRHKFDLWLISLIPKNVDIFMNTKCIKIEKKDGYFRILVRDRSEIKEFYSKVVIGADGANSHVRRKFFKTQICQYVCIQKSYKIIQHAKNYYVCFFDKKYTDCYGWIDIKNGVYQFGIALPKKDCIKSFSALKQEFQGFGYEFEDEVNSEVCLVNRPNSLNQIELGDNNIFLIGEAAGFVSPSSLEGISYAIDSAEILADILNSNFKNPNKEYKKSCLKLKFKIFLKILKVPFLFNPLLRKLIMKSGLESIRVKKS